MKILQNDNNNSKVVTVRLLVFLIDCIVPLLKVVWSPPKTILAAMKMLQHTFSKIPGLQRPWPSDQESLSYQHNCCCSEAPSYITSKIG